MVWTAALTNYSDGNTPTHTQLNEYLANLEWLKEPPTNSYAEPQGSNLTTTATTWADISANFSLSLTTTGGLVLVLLTLSVSNLDIDIAVDGTRRGTAGASGAGIARYAVSTTRHLITLPIIISGLAADSYTIAAQWKVPSAGTGTIYAGNQPRFYVREL